MACRPDMRMSKSYAFVKREVPSSVATDVFTFDRYFGRLACERRLSIPETKTMQVHATHRASDRRTDAIIIIMVAVVIGIAGDLVKPQDVALCSHYTTKAGGQPCLPLRTLSADQLSRWTQSQRCSVCCEALSLVLQVSWESRREAATAAGSDLRKQAQPAAVGPLGRPGYDQALAVCD